MIVAKESDCDKKCHYSKSPQVKANFRKRNYHGHFMNKSRVIQVLISEIGIKVVYLN